MAKKSTVGDRVPKRKDLLGRRGEELAADYLEGHGYRLLDRNWRCAAGEVDIVALHESEIVFVEVKTRSGLDFGHPFEAVTPRKLARLRRLSAIWCSERRAAGGLSSGYVGVRIDIIAVVATGEGPPVIEHLEGVF